MLILGTAVDTNAERTIWRMYRRYPSMGHKCCGDCRYFCQKQADTFVHPGFSTRHYRCGLFNCEFRTLNGWTDFGDGSTDWSAGWLACGAFWAHEGESE